MAGLFDAYKLKDVTLRNRIVVSPMCQYMGEDGVVTDWHKVHYSSLARGGSGLVIVEATSVAPEGRISWADLGLWNDRQGDALKGIVREIKQYGAVPGIQIAHAGRKASAHRPWEGDNHMATDDPRAWQNIAPSPLAFGGNLSRVPREMTIDDIARVQSDTVHAVERALDAGFEWLQMHFAHGYLAQNFFSPISNHRTDSYGGSAENRARYMFETFKAVRKVWPDHLPMTVRLGVIEFAGEKEDEAMVAESIALLKRLKDEGLDFVDVSMGFNTPVAKIPWGPHFMADTAEHIRQQTGLPGTTSWYVSQPKESDDLIRQGKIDLVTLGRPLLSDPHWPYHAARELGVENPAWATLPASYAHWLARYR
jgi:2,4-dienoyl-CoA reductase-like NADH-dependent reductase (Old Yellow Enzyme family)